jgi:hypothetical protein
LWNSIYESLDTVAIAQAIFNVNEKHANLFFPLTVQTKCSVSEPFISRRVPSHEHHKIHNNPKLLPQKHANGAQEKKKSNSN